MTKKSDKEWLARIVVLGCVAGNCGAPACVHHIRYGQGRGQRAPDRLAIPLCPRHHNGGQYKIAIHSGQKTWESIYGTELELLEQVYARLGEPWPPQELTELMDRQRIGSRIVYKSK